MDALQQGLSPLLAQFQELPSARKTQVVGAVVAALLVVVAASWWGSQTDYALLFGGLDAEDAGAIAQKLSERNVPHKVEDGGRVLAPRGQIAALRVELATEGLPRQGTGFELLDTQSYFGMSKFREHKAYERARNGELERTLSALTQVERAKVHVTEPDDSLFLEETTPAKASVYLRLEPGASLTPGQVEGVRRIVAGAVPKLSTENVTVIDETGRLLHPEGGTASEQGLELRRKKEQELVQKAEFLLARLPFRAFVRITAEVETEGRRVQEERFGEPVEVETQTTKKTKTDALSDHSTADTKAKVEGARPGASGKETKESENETRRINAFPRTVSESTTLPGRIKRLSVSLLLDKGSEEEALSQAAQEEAERLVKGAIGWDEARDGAESFQTVVLTLATPEVATTSVFELDPHLVARSVEVGASLILILSLIWAIRSLRPAPPEDDPLALPLDEGQEEENAAAEREAEALAQREADEREQLRLAIQSLVKDNPAAATEVIRLWLYEGEE